MSFVDWVMASFLYCFPYSYRSSNYCDSNSCRSTIATTIAIAIVGRAITLEREPPKKKQRTDTKKDLKRIKNDNFTCGNREKSNIAIGKLNDWMAT